MGVDQAMLFQKKQALFHVLPGQLQLLRLPIKPAQVCVEIGGEMSGVSCDLPQDGDGLLFQANGPMGVSLQSRPEVQEQSLIPGDRLGLEPGLFRQLPLNEMHARLVPVCLHIAEDVLQKADIKGRVVLLRQMDGVLHGPEQFLVPGNIRPVPEADILDAPQQGFAPTDRGRQVRQGHLPDHGLKGDPASGKLHHQSHLDQIVDGIPVGEFQPPGKPSGRDSGQGRQGQIPQHLLPLPRQLIQGEQGVDVAVVGLPGGFPVLGDADAVGGVQLHTFRPELFQQALGPEHSTVQQPGRQLHRQGVPVDGLDDLGCGLAMLLRAIIEALKQAQQGIHISDLAEHIFRVSIPDTPGGQQDPAAVVQHDGEDFLLIGGGVEVVHDDQRILF